MRDLNTIGEELFNKIRGRFPSVTIGDENGKVTNVPEEARFFDFAYSQIEPNNKVSVSINEKDGLSVIFNSNLIALEGDTKKSEWFEFLRELRKFARKRLLNFDTRDIERNSLKKRDYKYLAKKPKDGSMEESINESKMYGTARMSYQDVGNARLMVRHTRPVNTELPAGRTMHIEGIYIESNEGERFKYPFKHMAGARAMARHVSEGGKVHDDFGQHVTGLSEEMSKLRKFKTYMNRSSVMAEGLSGYMDVVNERVNEVRSRINKLQRENYYKEAFETFKKSELTEVPESVKEDWIAQLTIKQFNEELQDVFPYIYKLIGESIPKELIPGDAELAENEDNLSEKVEKIACIGCDEISTKAAWKKNNGTCPKCKSSTQGVAESNITPEEKDINNKFDEMMGKYSEVADPYGGAMFSPYDNEPNNNNAYDEAFEDLELIVANYDFDSVDDASNARASVEGIIDDVMDAMYDKVDNSIWPDLEADITKKAQQLVIAQFKKHFNTENGKEEVQAKQPQTPVSEYILSMFDRATGKFPKGETAILTSIEKDYGEKFIEPAKQFIGKINAKFAEHSQRPKMNDVAQLSDDQVTEKWNAPKNGKFTYPIEDPQTGAEIELYVEWEVIEDYDGSIGLAFQASTPDGQDYHIDDSLEDELSQHVDSEIGAVQDGYDDHMYQKQRDARNNERYNTEMSDISRLSGLK